MTNLTSVNNWIPRYLENNSIAKDYYSYKQQCREDRIRYFDVVFTTPKLGNVFLHIYGTSITTLLQGQQTIQFLLEGSKLHKKKKNSKINPSQI